MIEVVPQILVRENLKCVRMRFPGAPAEKRGGSGSGLWSESRSGRSPRCSKSPASRTPIAHRYRHTLATRLLERGATYELVADILGNTPEVVRKHYGKWAKGRQDNIDRFMMGHFQTMPATFPVTIQSHEKPGAVS
jgi:hypothetical protein